VTETFSFTRIEFSGRQRSGILDVLAGFVALLVAALFAFLVSLFVALFLGLLVALGVAFGVASIIGVGRSRGRRWWCYLIRIGRWIITGRENVARRIVMNKGPRKIKGSGNEERIQNYSGSHSANESKASRKTGSDENDSVSKTGSDKSDSTGKTGSDENSPVRYSGRHAANESGGYSAPVKTGSDDNGSTPRPGERRAGDGDQCDQYDHSDGFHSFSTNEPS
jgi:hypothetical protein